MKRLKDFEYVLLFSVACTAAIFGALVALTLLAYMFKVVLFMVIP